MIAKPICIQPKVLVVPHIDLSNCEGKGDCVEVCPYEVFEIRDLTQDKRKSLSLVGHIKTLIHGSSKGFVKRPELCLACGLCVKACPEKAIKLIKK